jgi:SP family sugar:H+ symporter-like MFS transporter
VTRVDSDKGNLQSKVFFIWGSFCFVCIAFVYFMIYETKGLTLEEVDELYALVSKAWLSKKFRPTVRFSEARKEMEGAEGRHMSLAEVQEARERRRSTVPGAGGNTIPEERAGETTALEGGNEVVGDEKRV